MDFCIVLRCWFSYCGILDCTLFIGRTSGRTSQEYNRLGMSQAYNNFWREKSHNFHWTLSRMTNGAHNCRENSVFGALIRGWRSKQVAGPSS